MTTRGERLSDLLASIGETFLNPWDTISVEKVEQDAPLFLKKLNQILDDEFVAGYDYHADPTAPMLPGRSNQKKTYYGAANKRGPGRPKKNPEIPRQPDGRHVTDDPES